MVVTAEVQSAGGHTGEGRVLRQLAGVADLELRCCCQTGA